MQINLKINAPGKPSSSFQNRLLDIQKVLFDIMRLLLSRNQSIIKQIDTSLAQKQSELSLKNKQVSKGATTDITVRVFAETNQHKSKLYIRLRAKCSKKLKDLGIPRTSG